MRECRHAKCKSFCKHKRTLFSIISVCSCSHRIFAYRVDASDFSVFYTHLKKEDMFYEVCNVKST